MNIENEISEIENELKRNEENTNLFKRRLFDVQSEEEEFEKIYAAGINDIEALPYVVKGDIVSKIQAESFEQLSILKKDTEQMFLKEKERVKEELKKLEAINDALNERKKNLQR